MHDIEPYYHWRSKYNSATDERSPFYGREYSEFFFSNRVYNYLIHPQWDEFGSTTLYAKILYVDYEEGYGIIELIGEWNDCLHNDVMTLLERIISPMHREGINRFLLICENVLNFHASDDCYYEEWYQQTILDGGGWITFINLHDHVKQEMELANIHYYVQLISQTPYFEWRRFAPAELILKLESNLSPNKYLE